MEQRQKLLQASLATSSKFFELAGEGRNGGADDCQTAPGEARLPAAAIRTTLEDLGSKPRDTVLDSFGGSGTTMIAAERTGRRAVLLEFDPAYVDVIGGDGRGGATGWRGSQLRRRRCSAQQQDGQDRRPHLTSCPPAISGWRLRERCADGLDQVDPSPCRSDQDTAAVYRVRQTLGKAMQFETVDGSRNRRFCDPKRRSKAAVGVRSWCRHQKRQDCQLPQGEIVLMRIANKGQHRHAEALEAEIRR